MESFTIEQPDGFDFPDTSAFLSQFQAMPASDGDNGLLLAFALDETWEPVGLRLIEQGRALRVDILSNPGGAGRLAMQHNLERLLGLRLDVAGYRAIGQRDPVVGRLQAEHPGVRPVLFPTAWEAGVWSILSQRTRRVQAVAIKRRLSEAHGLRVEGPDGTVLYSFPGPAIVRGISEAQGLPLQKIGWLHGLADAALQGRLQCDDLAEMTQADGMTALRSIPGIGPFSAELILARGAGNPDIFPSYEPMLHEIMTRLYGVADLARQQEIAEGWRPYRSWVSFLMRIGG